MRSKIEFLMVRASGWKLLTNMKNNSILDPGRDLDPTLITIMVYKLNGLSEEIGLKESHSRLVTTI